jgi:hypothetical protein
MLTNHANDMLLEEHLVQCHSMPLKETAAKHRWEILTQMGLEQKGAIATWKTPVWYPPHALDISAKRMRLSIQVLSKSCHGYADPRQKSTNALGSKL